MPAPGPPPTMPILILAGSASISAPLAGACEPLPALGGPRAHHGLLCPGDLGGGGKAWVALRLCRHRAQELENLDRLEVIVTEAVSPGRIEIGVMGMPGAAQH